VPESRTHVPARGGGMVTLKRPEGSEEAQEDDGGVCERPELTEIHRSSHGKTKPMNLYKSRKLADKGGRKIEDGKHGGEI
jgi:hypothetical protein